MRFGRLLASSIYEPWASHYVDYRKLKNLLREDSLGVTDSWTDEDESAFVDELVNVQLEKVNAWQKSIYEELRERCGQCESKLESLVASYPEDGPEEPFKHILHDLDGINKEINELEKYSRLCYTAFLKAAKKHDRRRGFHYKVRPLLQVRLAQLPCAVEDYSPLLYRLSAMYSFIRQKLGDEPERTSSSEVKDELDEYTSYKFFVHEENLLEVKTYILRSLPVLVYNPQSSKAALGSHKDPTITSLYFDNAKFALYTGKVEKASEASSLRLRWYGQLKDNPELIMEKKTTSESGKSKETRVAIKEKYVKPFLEGKYKMEKTVQKLLDRQGAASQELLDVQASGEEIQAFVEENQLQPVLRANHTRTAFQIPGDSRVRVSLDTNLALIREDALDVDRPCRDTDQWHRQDIDHTPMEFPFSDIKKGEISTFPYAVLNIKIRGSTDKRRIEWLDDLMVSHLVHEAPRFSKYVHGVAKLFDDHINTFPFWLSILETNIRRDPEAAFQEEQDRKIQQAQDKSTVGSFLSPQSASSFQPLSESILRRSSHSLRASSSVRRPSPELGLPDQRLGDDSLRSSPHDEESTGARLRSLFPSFSTSKYARAHRQRQITLPPGVRDPGILIKDMGPVVVEPKVWLANQRTFVKWQHISILLALLSLSLYNSAGRDNDVARALGLIYTLIAVFAAAWGWRMYLVRSEMIERRSGRDFDNVLGPLVVCLALVGALALNFGFMYQRARERGLAGL